MPERLQKIIAARGICSRRRAEEMITAGRVSVNGLTAYLGATADPEIDEIMLDGKPLPSWEAYVYLMLHKPRGYVTTLSDEKGRPDVSRLVADVSTRVYPVGRLDYDSEGLLIFTNDGEFANHLMHPKHQVEKTYDTYVTGYNPGCLKALTSPMELDGYRLRIPKVKLLKAEGTKARLLITIHEGRYRQVRRMCDQAGMTVTKLRRIQEGSVKLGKLPAGKWRYLTPEEVASLK